MSKYYATYKCRMCREIYRPMYTVTRKMAMRYATEAASEEGSKDLKLTDVHECTYGDLGIADFIGFARERDEDWDD